MHFNQKIGVIVEVNSETDFVAINAIFKEPLKHARCTEICYHGASGTLASMDKYIIHRCGKQQFPHP